jgi:putative sporulation protein YtaF
MAVRDKKGCFLEAIRPGSRPVFPRGRKCSRSNAPVDRHLNPFLGPATGEVPGGLIAMNRSYWVPALLLALSSNLDNVGVGVAYGIRRVRVPFASNLVIALITGTGTLASMLAGQTIGDFLEPRVAGLAGGSLLIGLGGWVVFQESHAVPQREAVGRVEISGGIRETSLASRVLAVLDNPFSADQDFSRHIDRREALLLGFALSLNNVVNGVAAGIAGLDPMLVTILVCIFSVLTIWIGMSAGIRFGSRAAGRSTGVVSGLLLIFIGVYQVFLQLR